VAPNERARKHHEELFPGHVSTLAVTDPELIEAFDTFAFDEVLRHGREATDVGGLWLRRSRVRAPSVTFLINVGFAVGSSKPSETGNSTNSGRSSGQC
jgi:hypothetical protein